ncbi:unnamed protein product [Rhizophagus irregularis]|nr:unnamed protein product [Rhizophagus irregularis]
MFNRNNKNWKQILFNLYQIIKGLNGIHEKGLIHYNFHNAPEILRGQSYTQASDIYSFSIIMWEFTSEIPSFNDKAHDLQLASSICIGGRPEIIEKYSTMLYRFNGKMLDEDPLKRPSSKEILNIIDNWIFCPKNKKIEDINEELKSNIMEFINAPIERNNLIVKSHPKACYTSHLLDLPVKNSRRFSKDFWNQKYQISQMK